MSKKTTKGVKKQSSATPLSVSSVGPITLGQDDSNNPTAANQQTYYALSASPEDDVLPDTNQTTDRLDVGSCQPVSTAGAEAGAALWAYNDNVVSRISKPDNCFRITVDGKLERNYLDAYTVTMAPKDADVTWGKVDWWEDADDMTCPEMSFEAAEQVDVCSMFEDEVARLPDPTAEPVVRDTSTDPPANLTDGTSGLLVGFNLKFKDAAKSRHRFTAMWYARNKDDGKAESPPPNLYADVEDDVGTEGLDETHTVDVVSGYDATAWVRTVDKDNDPIYGDLGKVDAGGDDKADNFTDSDDSNACTGDDGGTARSTVSGKKINNGTLCNAAGVEIETEVTFPLGLGYGCDDVKKTYTLTCDWKRSRQSQQPCWRHYHRWRYSRQHRRLCELQDFVETG